MALLLFTLALCTLEMFGVSNLKVSKLDLVVPALAGAGAAYLGLSGAWSSRQIETWDFDNIVMTGGAAVTAAYGLYALGAVFFELRNRNFLQHVGGV